MKMKRTLDFARLYLSERLSVIPLVAKRNNPAIESDEFHTRLPKDSELMKWFWDRHNYNVGIITGVVSGIIVIRIQTTLMNNDDEIRKFILETPTVNIPSGMDIYYRMPTVIGNLKLKDDLAGVQLIGQDNYVAAPPSCHQTYGEYIWMRKKGLKDLPMAELPENLWQIE